MPWRYDQWQLCDRGRAGSYLFHPSDIWKFSGSSFLPSENLYPCPQCRPDWTFNEGFLLVLSQGRVVDIDDAVARHLHGVRQGINLPLRLEGEIVGVIGLHLRKRKAPFSPWGKYWYKRITSHKSITPYPTATAIRRASTWGIPSISNTQPDINVITIAAVNDSMIPL